MALHSVIRIGYWIIIWGELIFSWLLKSDFSTIFWLHSKFLKLAVFCYYWIENWMLKPYILRLKMHVLRLNVLIFTINMHFVIVIEFLIANRVQMIWLWRNIFDTFKFLKQALFHISQNAKLRNCLPFEGPYSPNGSLIEVTSIQYKCVVTVNISADNNIIFTDN